MIPLQESLNTVMCIHLYTSRDGWTETELVKLYFALHA